MIFFTKFFSQTSTIVIVLCVGWIFDQFSSYWSLCLQKVGFIWCSPFVDLYYTMRLMSALVPARFEALKSYAITRTLIKLHTRDEKGVEIICCHLKRELHRFGSRITGSHMRKKFSLKNNPFCYFVKTNYVVLSGMAGNNSLNQESYFS